MENTPLNYPLILVHGIMAKDSDFFWGRIINYLKDHGVELYLGNTDAWADIEHNALLLRRCVNAVLKKTGKEKVNIIAHSKGGIDSRYLISGLKYGNKIASLTTISTPHRGSEIADYLFAIKKVQQITSTRFFRKLFIHYGDHVPNPYIMLKNLTTDYMKEFNEKYVDDERVYYSSYHSFIPDPWRDMLYFHSYNYLKKKAGLNDGVVSLKSAKWGSEFNVIEGVSHSEIIDLKKKTISGVDIPKLYLDIVKKLSDLGY